MYDSKISLAEKITFIIGIIVGLIVLYWISSSNKGNFKFDDLALGEDTISHFGKVENLHVHCLDESDLYLCLSSYYNYGKNSNVTLWLGNSQLHSINQFKTGQETATVKLHRLAKKHNQYLFSISQPNANLQEHFLVIAHLIKKIPVKHLILPVVFDDMREDGIRFGLNFLLRDKTTINLINNYETGVNLLLEDIEKNKNKNKNKIKSLLDKSEDYLDKKLGSIWSLWSKRPDFRGNFFNFLYKLRNFVFQIDPSTTRKILPGPYKKNFEALNSIIKIAKDNKINLIIYNVPIRNDFKIPYNIQHYNKFKKDLNTISSQYSIKFINLENIIPNYLWGETYSTSISRKNDIDFMHFKEPGHKILSEALYSEMVNYWIKN